LHDLILRREQWRAELNCIRRMHARVLEVEAILAGSWALDEAVTNLAVAARFDAWVIQLRSAAARAGLTETEARCVGHFLHVTQNMRPQLIHCYDVAGLPRTNNDMEGFIRALKTRYRRISGRKSWNRYLLRYGRRVAYYEARMRMEDGGGDLVERVCDVTPAAWRAARAEQRARQEEQLKQHRFRHKRSAYLHSLEQRWAAATPGTGLLPQRTGLLS
jgi:hypothetical protein